MTCKYCNGKLAPLRSLTDGEFCSDVHRYAYYDEHPEEVAAEASLPSESFARTGTHVATAFDAGPAAEAREFSRPSGYRVSFAPKNEPAEPAAPAEKPEDLIQASVAQATAEAELPPSTPEPETAAYPAFLEELVETPSFLDRFIGAAQRQLGRPIQWLVTAWGTAPTELRAMALLLPVLLALACSPLMSKLGTSLHAGKSNGLPGETRQVFSKKWKALQERISDRAAVVITDDFRTGLDAWQSRSNLTTAWSFDSNGFLQPGPLAILKPTLELTDYSFEFLGEIQRRGLGCAFRARDLNNYYAVKFIEDRSGPLPAMRLVRYAVIDGREGPHVERALPSSLRSDVFNRFRVEAHGSDFTILAQGEVVDFFSDARLASGGVGFFCNRGESARLRWMEVSHQYDTLGRLCAFFSPVNVAGVDKN